MESNDTGNAAKQQKQNIHGGQSHQELVKCVGHFLFDENYASGSITYQTKYGHN